MPSQLRDDPRAGQDPVTIEPARQAAEWLPARQVLTCRPTSDAFFGDGSGASDFLRVFWRHDAVEEHQAMRQHLEACGARVVDVREVLLGCQPTALREAARHAVTYQVDPALSVEDRVALAGLHERTIEALDARALADLALLRPALHVGPNRRGLDPASRFRVSFEFSPATSAYFVRDPILVTAAGVVVGRTRLESRRLESEVAALVLDRLGIAPLLRVADPGVLEGGDFLPAGGFVLQGEGPFSNAEGIGQLLDAGAYGPVEVAVVRGPLAHRDHAHLDSWFCFYGPTLAGISERYTGPEQPEVDVYAPEGSPTGCRYRKAGTSGLLDYLQTKRVQVLPFTAAEEANAAANGLLVAPMHYLAPSCAGATFVHRLQRHGVRVDVLGWRGLPGRGGPRGATQVLSRSGS